jgi:DNA-binding Lrp family transcriptional regulator
MDFYWVKSDSCGGAGRFWPLDGKGRAGIREKKDCDFLPMVYDARLFDGLLDRDRAKGFAMSKENKALDQDILDILRDNAKCPLEDMAKMTGAGVEEVRQAVERLEKDGIVVKYRAVINWERIDNGPRVTALIEVKVTPKRGYGFDKVAERIYQFPEVRSLYLLSGGYDLLAIVEGNSLHEGAACVAEKLSALDDVQSTATHFLLKRYKDDGDILYPIASVSRLEVSP